MAEVFTKVPAAGAAAAPVVPTASPPPAPTTPEGARARLKELTADKGWSNKVVAGDIDARRVRSELVALAASATPGGRLANALSGTVVPGMIENTSAENPLTTSELRSAVDGLRKDGHSDEIIRAIVEGEPVTPERHREAELVRERLMRDRKWLQDYRAGSSDHVQQMHRINAVLAAPIAETK